jgi:hypothetical protein
MTISQCLQNTNVYFWQILNDWNKDTIMWLIKNLSYPIDCIIDDDEYVKLILLETAHESIKKKQKITAEDIIKLNVTNEKLNKNINELQNIISNNTMLIPTYEEIDDIESAIKFLNDIDTKSYEWLKKEYSDVCSGGDVIINKLLDATNKNKLTWNDIINLSEGYSEDEKLYFIDHIFQSYKGYLEGREPDPWWAS